VSGASSNRVARRTQPLKDEREIAKRVSLTGTSWPPAAGTRSQNFKYRLDPSVGAELTLRSVVLSDAWPSVSRMVAAGAPR
jgi:hypothetical protein